MERSGTVDRGSQVEPNQLVLSDGHIRPTRAEIRLSALLRNVDTLAAAAQKPILAVIKADAYGHGAVQVAGVLSQHPKVAGLAVSLVEEACELQDAGIRAPIVVMGPVCVRGYEEVVVRDLVPFISDRAGIELFRVEANKRKRRVFAHLKVDTGMGRMGIPWQRVSDCLALDVSDGLIWKGIATHLACADTDRIDDFASQTLAQLARFQQVIEQVPEARSLCSHAANSAAILRFGQIASFDMVRPGLALYGTCPHAELGVSKINVPPGTPLQSQGALGLQGHVLEPVLSWRTEIVQLRSVVAGTSVSYGALWKAPRSSVLAVIPVGYADGYPRTLTGKAEVLVGGIRCPVVGAICMDVCIVDVTALRDNVRVGQEVVLLGGQGVGHIGVPEFAERSGRIEYEVTCGISKRVPRIFR